MWHDNERFLLQLPEYRRSGLQMECFPPNSGDLNTIETVWFRQRPSSFASASARCFKAARRCARASGGTDGAASDAACSRRVAQNVNVLLPRRPCSAAMPYTHAHATHRAQVHGPPTLAATNSQQLLSSESVKNVHLVLSVPLQGTDFSKTRFHPTRRHECNRRASRLTCDV